MKLTPAQNKFLDAEYTSAQNILKYKPENPFDSLCLKMKMDQIRFLRQLHNIAIREERDAN